MKSRIVFDSCSQRSYITQRLRENLNLLPNGSDTMKITAFGDKEPRQRECEKVQISITALDGMELYVNGYVAPIEKREMYLVRQRSSAIRYDLYPLLC